MANAVDPLLNNAVDLYVQAVDYRGFRQARFWHWSMPKYEKLCWNPAMSGYHHRIPAVLCQIQAGFQAIWSGSWTDPSILAGSPASLVGILTDPVVMVGILPKRQDQDHQGQLPANWPGFGHFVPDSGEDHWYPTQIAGFRLGIRMRKI
jgi:hypothetical protein